MHLQFYEHINRHLALRSSISGSITDNISLLCPKNCLKRSIACFFPLTYELQEEMWAAIENHHSKWNILNAKCIFYHFIFIKFVIEVLSHSLNASTVPLHPLVPHHTVSRTFGETWLMEVQPTLFVLVIISP